VASLFKAFRMEAADLRFPAWAVSIRDAARKAAISDDWDAGL